MSKADKKIADKMSQLDELINWFDSDDFAIDLALEKYKAAEKLAKEIESDLIAMKNEVNVLKAKFDTEI